MSAKGKGSAKAKGPSKAEQQALLAAANGELMARLLQVERHLVFAEETRWEAVREERLLEDKYQTLERDLKEKRRWHVLMEAELDRQFAQLQQQEAAECRLLQQQIQEQQQQQQQQQHLQKQITVQEDINIADTEHAIKELRGKCEKIADEFMSLIKETIEKMESKFSFKMMADGQAVAAFAEKISVYKNDIIQRIEAFFAEKQQDANCLGDSWRGMGLVPPSAVTKLGV